MGILLRLTIFLPAIILFYNNTFSQSHPKLDSLTLLYENTTVDSTRAKVLTSLAEYHSENGEYLKSIEYNLKAVKIFHQLHLKEQEGNSINSIGASYYYMQNWDKAIEYFNKAYVIAIETNNIEDQARFMNNIGVIYEKIDDIDNALKYQTKSLSIKYEIGDSLSISRSLLNIGNIYIKKKDYKKAINFFEKSLEIKRNYKDLNGLSAVLQNIGFSYYLLEDYPKAIKYNMEALEVARNSKNIYNEHTAYVKLGDIYDTMKNYQKANEYIKLANNLEDSLIQMNNAELLADMEAKYQAEIKDNEIALQQIEIERRNTEVKLQTTQKIWFAVGLFLAIILLFVAYRGNQQKKKANKMLEEKNLIIQEKNKDILDSITYASNIQKSILPNTSEITRVFKEHFIYFKPKDIVSGDFYWFHEKEDLAFIIAADCTGHGVPGAFVSMLCNNAFNQVIIEKDCNDPGEILTLVNNTIISSLRKEGANFQSNDGMDCSLCVIDKKQKSLRYAGSYNQLIYITNNEINEVKADRTPIGGRTKFNYQFSTKTVDTKPGDTIYLFSDGYADQFGGEKGKKFMIKKLKELFLQIHKHQPEEQKTFLNKTFNDWKGNNQQVDDVLVLGIKL